MNQQVQASGLQDAKKKDSEEGEQAATCRRLLMILRIWGLGKPYWARWSMAASIRRSPLLGLGRPIASAAPLRGAWNAPL